MLDRQEDIIKPYKIICNKKALSHIAVNAMHNRKAETGPFTQIFSGIVRFKYFIHDIPVHAMAGIADGKFQVRAGLCF